MCQICNWLIQDWLFWEDWCSAQGRCFRWCALSWPAVRTTWFSCRFWNSLWLGSSRFCSIMFTQRACPNSPYPMYLRWWASQKILGGGESTHWFQPHSRRAEGYPAFQSHLFSPIKWEICSTSTKEREWQASRIRRAQISCSKICHWNVVFATKTSLRSLQEYFDVGRAEIVPAEDLTKPASDVFYLPMHAVHKESSTITRIRAVFNASMKTTSGILLNNTLIVGSTVHPPLIYVLLQFRMHCIAIVADISKMYRAVELPPANWDLTDFCGELNPRIHSKTAGWPVSHLELLPQHSQLTCRSSRMQSSSPISIY